MKRLEFSCKEWTISPFVPESPAKKLVLPDFEGKEKECWHLRCRGWRWTGIRKTYPGLNAGEDCTLTFWGKIDYFSGQASQCRVDLYDSDDWTPQVRFDISPICANAAARKGDWVLYKLPFTARSSHVLAEIIAFEANIAVMQAMPDDERAPGVAPINHAEDIKPFTAFDELPFREHASLEQRMVQYYRDLLAPYKPSPDIPEANQKDYYAFVEALYERLYADHGSFFTRIFEDDAFPNRFSNVQYGKPELKPRMRDDQKKIEGLFTLLAELVKTGELSDQGLRISDKLSRKQLHQLACMGLEMAGDTLKSRDFPLMFGAVQYLAEKERSPWPLMFCWFEDPCACLEEAYARLFDKAQYDRLINWLCDHGYRRGSHSGLSLDFYKSVDGKERPLGFAIHGDKFHYGFTFNISPEARVRHYCGLRIIQFGQMLKHFDDLSEETKKLIGIRNKRCDNCRYCVQMDKTGTRPLAAIAISSGENLCPYYPGYTYTYEYLSARDIDGIIAFLTDMEDIINEGKKGGCLKTEDKP
jgi:hypothetical protein